MFCWIKFLGDIF